MRRAFISVASAVFGPILAAVLVLAVSVPLGMDDAPDRAFEIGVWWSWLAFPYGSVRPQLVSPGVAMLLAIVQWFLVSAAMGVATRRSCTVAAVLATCGAVVIVGMVVLRTLSAFGFSPVFEGP